MKQVFRINKNKMYVEPVIVNDDEELAEDLIDDEIPEGFYQPKWNGEEWIEGLTQEEIDLLVNISIPKTEIEILQEENQRLKAEAEALRQRDAKMQDDINFIFEVMGG